MMTDDELITERDLTPYLNPSASAPTVPFVQTDVMAEPITRLDSVERGQILKVLSQTGGNKAAAARALGVSRRALYRKLERHGLLQEEPQ
jgi:transcriptional regulator of acetoin/glycerol metabolism